MLKPKIRMQGILLVGFPLLCQLVFVSALFVVLLQLQTELIKESRDRELASSGHEVMRDVIEIVTYSYLGHERNQLMDSTTSGQKVERLKPKLKNVVDLAKECGTADPQEIVDFHTASNDMFNLFDWACKEQAKGLQHWRKVKRPLDHAMMTTCQTFMNALGNLLVGNEKQTDAPSPALVALQDKVKVVLIVAFVASILIAIAMALLFVAGINRPLVRLTFNSHRLSAHEELLPSLPGNDEFAQLDRLIHATSTAIKQAMSTEQAMITNAADLICSLDASGVFTRVNPYAATMFGCDKEELIGKSIYDMVLEEDLVKAEDEITSVVISQKSKVFELRMRKADSTAIDTRWSAFWSDNDDRLFCVVHDVTEEKNIERLKQDFLDMISHDLRSPLTAMLASITMMSAGVRGPIPESAQKKVKKSVQDIEQLIDFVNDLLDYQKLQAGRMPVILQATGLGALISESVGNVKSIADEKNIEISVPTGDWQANCDKPKIGQVLINFLTFAIDEATPGTRIVLEVEDETESGHTIKLKYVGGHSADPIDDLFERVSDTPLYDGGRPGIGVRLALCKLIVESHGGTLGAKREEFTGERFSRKVKIEFDNTLWFALPAKSRNLTVTSSLFSLR